MSRMSNLDAELRAAGIDPEVVDLEVVEAYREWWQEQSGMAMTFIEAAKLIHC